MTCKNCGTEIADKAIVCYRCGQSTTEARLKPAALASRGRSLIVTLAFVLLMLAALFMGQAGTDALHPAVSWAIGVIAAVIVVCRLAVRRR